MFKFLHIADVHFDAPLMSKDTNVRSDLKASQKDAFRKAVDFCIKEEIDGLLIAGDLFDNERISLNTEKFLWENFEKLREKNIHVFYTPGNHDPVIYMKSKFGDNVHIFDRDVPTEYIIKDKHDKVCRIIGVGHINDNEKRNLIRKFPKKMDDRPIVGIAHTMVENVEVDETKGKYMPTSLEDLLDKKYDYWALGHIHSRMQFKDYPIFYSGNIQGLNINETGLKGGNFIKVDNGLIEIEFIPLNTVFFEHMTIDITGEYGSEYDFYNILKGLIAEELLAFNYNSSNLIIRLFITGQTNMVKYLNSVESIEYLEEELAQDLDIKSLEIKKYQLKNVKKLEDLIQDNKVLEEVMMIMNNPNGDKKMMKNMKHIKYQIFDNEENPESIINQHKEELMELMMAYFTGDES
ncbi:MAG: metallophosphoesterase [Clostridiales bacterium]|nr:metallophosphoesterase [Clostridiales bacterium]